MVTDYRISLRDRWTRKRAIYVVYDIKKKGHWQKMPIMNVVWPITVFYLCPIGLWAYWHLGHSNVNKKMRTFYKADDPFSRSGRELDDRQRTLDHFQTKLLKLGDLMHTTTAKRIAQQRTKFMMLFIRQLQKEII
jgi:hypothetical protein